MTPARDPDRPRAGRGRASGLPDQPRRAVPEGLDQRRRCCAPPDRLTSPLRARRGRRRSRPAAWDEALDVRRRPGRRRPRPVTVRTRSAVFGGGGLTNEKAYQLGQVRPARRCAPRSSTTTAGSACPRPPPPATAPSASTAACRSRWPTSAARTPCCCSAATSPTRCRRSSSTSAGVRERGGLVVVDPRRSATAALTDGGGGAAPAAVPGHRPDPAARAAAPRGGRGPGRRRTTSPPRDHRLGRRPRRASRCGGPTGSPRVTGVPGAPAAPRRRSCSRPRRRRAAARRVRAHRSRRRAAHRTAPTPSPPRSTSRWRSACRAAPVSGYGCLTGQGNGQGGREHGQKSDQLPGYRSIEDPAARRHVAGVWGVDPASLPGKGVPAVELLRRLGDRTASAALLRARHQPGRSAPRTPRAVAERLEPLDLLVVCDFVPSETALLADVVLPVTQWAEEEGTMTSLEGRVLRRRRAVAPPAGVRERARRPRRPRRAGSASPAGSTRDARRGLRRARPGQRGWPGRLLAASTTTASTPARRLHWPCPAAAGRRPGHAAAVPRRASRTPDGRARMVAGRPRPTGRRPAPRRPALPGHRPGAGALPVGRADPPGRGAEPRRAPGPSSSCTRTWRPALGVEDGDRVTVDLRPRHGDRPARITAAIRPDTVFMPFHWPGDGMANARHQRRHRPDLRDARVQGVRRPSRAPTSAVRPSEEVPRMSAHRDASRRRRCRHGRPPLRRRAGPARPAAAGSRSS